MGKDPDDQSNRGHDPNCDDDIPEVAYHKGQKPEGNEKSDKDEQEPQDQRHQL